MALKLKKTRMKPAAERAGAGLIPVRTPPINLHDLEAVRREMARVYRDMRNFDIDSQDGTRLVYALSQVAKLHESAELERRIIDLERGTV